MGFSKDKPAIDVGWATIYLTGDEIIICTNIRTPATVESTRNGGRSLVHDEATHVTIAKNKTSR